MRSLPLLVVVDVKVRGRAGVQEMGAFVLERAYAPRHVSLQLKGCSRSTDIESDKFLTVFFIRKRKRTSMV